MTIKNIIAVLLLLIIFPSTAFTDLRVVPAVIRAKAVCGESYETTITLLNTSKDTVEHLKIYLEGNQRNIEGKWEYGKKAGGVMSMLGWTTVLPETLSILPGKGANVIFRMEIPKQVHGDFRVALMVDQDISKGGKPDLDKKDTDVDEILLGKRRAGARPEKTTIGLGHYFRIAVPVVIRVSRASGSLLKMRPEVKFAKLKIKTADEGKGTIIADLVAENTGFYDIQITGACKILHGKRKSTLKIADLSGEKILITPKSKRLLKFIFSDPLPAGDYIASASLKIKNRGLEKVAQKGIKIPFRIDSKMAQVLAKLAAGNGIGGDTPHVPLIVDPGRISLSNRGTRIKPLKLTVTNPTNQTLNIRSIFRSASQSKKNKPSAKITPARLSIEPGKSERIRVQIKPSGKGPVYGRLLFAVKGMGGSRPAEVPVMIVPKGIKLNPSGSIADLEVFSTKDGKSVRISGKLKNTGNAHFDDISAEISIKDFLDNPVKKNRASVSRRVLFPAEKTRLFSDFSLSDLKDDIYKAVFVVKSKGAKTISNSFRFKVDSESDKVVRLVD